MIFTDVAATSAADGSTPTPVPTEGLSTTPTASPTDASDPSWVTEALYAEFQNFVCACLDQANTNVAPANEPLITCETDGSYKYILGPVEVTGDTISDATSGLIMNSQGVSTGQWGVFITFNDEGTQKFAKVTERLYGFPQTDPRNRFAIVLDGRVISAPTSQGIITDGKPLVVDERELPDYLPVMLEFASALSREEAGVFLCEIRKVLTVLAGNLEKSGSAHAPLVRIVENHASLTRLAA